MRSSIARAWPVIRDAVRRRCVIAASTLALTAVGFAVMLSAQASSAAGTAPALFFPSTAQAGKAIVAAHLEAATTIPGPHGFPVTSSTAGVSTAADALLATAARASSWPANVTGVQYIGTYRKTAEQFVDGTTVRDNPAVVVVRMTGHFSVLISAPSGARPFATGTVLTAVVDADTGQVLDFGLGNSAKALPNHVIAFRR
jgi:hypothetical protein